MHIQRLNEPYSVPNKWRLEHLCKKTNAHTERTHCYRSSYFVIRETFGWIEITTDPHPVLDILFFFFRFPRWEIPDVDWSPWMTWVSHKIPCSYTCDFPCGLESNIKCPYVLQVKEQFNSLLQTKRCIILGISALEMWNVHSAWCTTIEQFV